MYFCGYYIQVFRESDNVWRMLQQMKNKTKQGGGQRKNYTKGFGYTNSKTWQLGTDLESSFCTG